MKGWTLGLNKGEWMLWGASSALILIAFAVFDGENGLTLTASLVGVASLMLNAKGNPLGQGLMLAFSLLYGAISLRCAYYGEMLTYLGMTAPMAAVALISWLRNPYGENRSEVAVGRLRRGEPMALALMTAGVTAAFSVVLKALGTANLIPSTISVATSFIAAYLTFRRSACFALAYAANDVVLIVLWVMAATVDRAYLSVVVCFALFLVNDLYGFVCWRKMERRQKG